MSQTSLRPTLALPASAPLAIDKSRLTTLVTAAITLAGLFMEGAAREATLGVGLFGLSGAVTNWIAIHMLFEKVPGLYGSGVVQARFREIKAEIRNLIIDQFFDRAHIAEVVGSAEGAIDLAPALNAVDLEPAWHRLVDLVMTSHLGGALGMFGGAKALDPLREGFEERTRSLIADIAASDAVRGALRTAAMDNDAADRVREQVIRIIDRRVEELSPALVKAIVQRMISQYLGWLVVWGGVFGGLIGLAAALVGI